MFKDSGDKMILYGYKSFPVNSLKMLGLKIQLLHSSDWSEKWLQIVVIPLKLNVLEML